MPTIEINDTTLFYERAGQGPAVLFVHGLSGHADVWAEQADRLADRYTCVRYDRRGHSRSARGDAAVTQTLHADDAAGLIEALGLAPCLLVGSSSGAAIVVDVTLRHRHLVRGVVLSEPTLFSLDPEGRQAMLGEVMPPVEQAMAAGGPVAGLDAFLSTVCAGLWSICSEAEKDRYRANAEIAFVDLQSPPIEVSAADVASIAVPALVITGRLSHPTFRSVAHRLVGALGDARLVELEGSGHVTYAEQPDAFAAAVAAFAGEVDRRAAAGGTVPV